MDAYPPISAHGLADENRVIRLADERYARLVVGVDDPAQTVAAIRQALGTTGRAGERSGQGPASGRRAPVPASRQRRVAGGREHRWALAPTTSRPGGTKLGGEGLHGLLEGGLR